MSTALFKWKEEPLSPVSNEEVIWLSEETFYQNSDEDDPKLENDLVLCETKVEGASLMLENLENLIDLDELIKDEPFLLDHEKILPMLEEVEQTSALAAPHYVKVEQGPPDTQFLLKEFETVYDVVEFTHETLTPPQSPPAGEGKVLTTLEPLLTQQPSNGTYPIEEKTAIIYSPVPEKHLLPETLAYRVLQTPVNLPLEYAAPVTPQPDIAHELAVVDELVRTRVEDMQWSSGPSSPNSNSSSGSSNFGDCSSDDPEWVPEPIENFNGLVSKTETPRKRTKPYSRSSQVDKKSRKKEQNKNAATRYRMKKKAEVEVILTEEKGLAMQNDDLSNQITDLQREIKYLKGLMRDLFKAKGLIN